MTGTYGERVDDRLEAGIQGEFKSDSEGRSQDGGKAVRNLGAISPRKAKKCKIEALKELTRS